MIEKQGHSNTSLVLAIIASLLSGGCGVAGLIAPKVINLISSISHTLVRVETETNKAVGIMGRVEGAQKELRVRFEAVTGALPAVDIPKVPIKSPPKPIIKLKPTPKKKVYNYLPLPVEVAAEKPVAAFELANLESEMLGAHNDWREEVNGAGAGVPLLSWDKDLASSAQEWADTIAVTCEMKHSDSYNGENIYYSSSLTLEHPQEVVDSWGSEAESYDYASNTCSETCGHYKQVVWKYTTKVGCAVSKCKKGGQIWVCSYSPTGNIINSKPY